MARECQNIYKTARKSAGITQERAAELLNVSIDSLRDYEGNQRPVPNDVAGVMCDIYQTPYLALQHIHNGSKIGARVVPEVQLKELPEAVLSVLAAVQRFIAKRDALIEITSDCTISETERAEWNAILQSVDDLQVALVNMKFSKGGGPR